MARCPPALICLALAAACTPELTTISLDMDGAASLTGPDLAAGAGRLERHSLYSRELDQTREVYVYLPGGYDLETSHRYPLLLVHDGEESVDRGRFPEVAETTFAAGRAERVVIAFVALSRQSDRMSEYSCDPGSQGPRYTAFLCDTLIPWIDASYRTTGRPDDRGLIGSSMGGLISFAAAFWRQDCVRRAGGQSGSFWLGNEMMVKRVLASPGLPLRRAYLDNGAIDDNQRFVHDMRDALRASGYAVHHWENPAHAHTWTAWQERFDEALSWLYPP